MDICLHLGAHRTGSTSLQIFFNENRKAFLRDDTTFWGPGRTRSGMFAGLIRDPNRLSPSDREIGTRSVGRIKIELARAEQNGLKRLVLSEENMQGTMMHNFTRSRLYSQVGKRLSRFAPAFEGRRMRIGLCVRSYDSYWASALAFRIKNGSALPSADQLDRLTTQPRRWRHVIEDISDVFPKAEIVVWSFEALGHRTDQQAQALTGCALPAKLRKSDGANNASLTAVEVGAVARERGQDDIADKLEQQIGRYQPFDMGQLHKLRQDYVNDISWLLDGSDGLATYFDPTGDTSGGAQDARGRDHDQERRMGRTRRGGTARSLAG